MFNILKRLSNSRKSLAEGNYNDLLFEIDEITREKLQKAILEMYKDVLSVCSKNNITAFLIGGSTLGAVRHGGFIPWDDDIDIGMTRADYNRFVPIFEMELSGKYTINAPNLSKRSKTRFTKIFKKGTICREITDILDENPDGIFLDVFIIENVPRNKLVRKIKGINCDFLQFISSQVYLYENNNDVIKEVYLRSGDNYQFRMIIGKLFSFRNSSKWFDSVDKAAQYKKTGIYGIVTGRKHYFGEIFDESVFFPAKYIQFCDIKAPVFQDTDTYLRNLYGDYMVIPPLEKRERHLVRELKL